MKDNKRFLNDEIKASKVRLISNEWEIIWEMSLIEAKQKANENWLDLMKVWEEWDITIIKMLDYWKFIYKQNKKDKKQRQKWKTPDLKTIKITFKIWDNDIKVKRNQAEKFAKDRHPLKVMLVLKWRENYYEEIAINKIESFISMLEPFYKIDKKLTKIWNSFVIMLSPK